MQRILPLELKEHFDKTCGPFEDLESPTAIFLTIVKSCTGIAEVGHNGGKIVELFQASVGIPKGSPWCLAFPQGVIAYVESLTGIKSGLAATGHCLGLWNASAGIYAVTEPRPGDLIIYRHRGTSSGHAAVIQEVQLADFLTVEGNTGPGRDIEREGDGVYSKKRPRGGSKTFEERGFLRPFWV